MGYGPLDHGDLSGPFFRHRGGYGTYGVMRPGKRRRRT